jgi:hypothetical protein
MKEEMDIGGNKAWILIEPHLLGDLEDDQHGEYFTASYSFEEQAEGPAVVLFLQDDLTAKRFESPVQALEYASEKLLGRVRP